MGFQGVEVLGVLTIFTALLVSIASAQILSGLPGDVSPSEEGGSEAYSHRDSGTTLYSAYNFLKCTSDLHLIPNSTQDVSDLIKLYTASNQPVKIRATRPGFHSSAGFVCPGKRDSSKKKFKRAEASSSPSPHDHPESITMLLHQMNRVVSVDPAHHQLTVEAGMTLLDLANAAEANNMSVRPGAFSVYSNLTVGGMITASAHGSGLGTVSSLGSLVRKIKWVNAKGEVLVSDSETEAGAQEVNALVGGLGLLGISTEFTLQLEPNSRTIIEGRENLSDKNIVADLKHMLKHETPHVITLWRPDLGIFRVQMFTHVGANETLPSTAPAFNPTGRNAYFAPFDDQTAGFFGELMAASDGDVADESAAADAINAGICEIGAMTAPLFSEEDGTPISHATVPTNYAAIGPDCAPKCFFSVHHVKGVGEDIEFTIRASQLEEWVEDVKAIIKAELQEVQDRLDKRYGKGKVRRCLPPGYFWIRFGQGTESLLATTTGTEDLAFVQWGTANSAMFPSKPAKLFTMVQTIEQLSLCKYKARPHWGKNHERVFRHPECHVRDHYPAANIEQVIEMQARHDPHKVFQPELFSHLLHKHGPDYSDLCTLHYWCYCQEDAHCPHRHACQPSPVFPQYKVCRLVVDNQHDEL